RPGRQHRLGQRLGCQFRLECGAGVRRYCGHRQRHAGVRPVARRSASETDRQAGEGRRAVVMEQMPYRDDLELHAVQLPQTGSVVTSDWRSGLPVLSSEQVVLRELRASDAPSLFAMLTTEEVARFISPPPTTIDGFERFIAWTLRQRAAGL